jgi:hypothetical protein
MVITGCAHQLRHGLHRVRERKKQRVSSAQEVETRGVVLQQKRSISRACGRLRGERWNGSHDSSEEWTSETERRGQGCPQTLGSGIRGRGRGLVLRQTCWRENRSGLRRQNGAMTFSAHTRMSRQTWYRQGPTLLITCACTLSSIAPIDRSAGPSFDSAWLSASDLRFESMKT